ncbi:hypothetical protein ACFL59_07485 [Planctomycetota bacterium]
MTECASLYIPEMHSFCDRWCERCTMTGRCKSCGTDPEDDDADRDLRNEQLWSVVADKLPDALRLLETAATEEGVPPAEPAVLRSDSLCQATATDQRVLDAAHRYALGVYGWLNRFPAPSEQPLHDSQIRRQRADPDGTEAETLSITDVVEVVHWYGALIAAKIAGGIGCRDDVANGFVKVALLGMDRSLGAWAFLRDALPDEADTIRSFLVDLGRLRQQTERAFPHARAFRRPGFDDG